MTTKLDAGITRPVIPADIRADGLFVGQGQIRTHALRKTSTWPYRLLVKLMYPGVGASKSIYVAVVEKNLGEGSEESHAKHLGEVLLVHRWLVRPGGAVGRKSPKV
jgi:hypothetical protein